MSAAVASEAQPFEALPLVEMPETFEHDLPHWTARMAHEVGPIFRVQYPGGFTPAYNNLESNNAQTRQDTGRWNANRDSNVGPVLRGRY